LRNTRNFGEQLITKQANCETLEILKNNQLQSKLIKFADIFSVVQLSTTEMPNHNFYISNGEVLCSKCGFKRGEGSLVCQVENEQPAQGKYQISIELFSSGYLFYSR